MKNSLKIALAVGAMLTLASCEMFEIDNFEGPNASIHGRILDAQGGALVETDIQNGSNIKVVELGWQSESTQTWVIKQNGEYRNDMVFAGTYRVSFSDCNFYPFTEAELVVKEGDNTKDFTVTPYIRVKNANITKTGNIVTATFSLEAGKPEVKLSSIQLYAFTDIYVGEQVKFDIDPNDNPDTPAFEPTDYKQFSPAIAIDGTTYTLSIDVTNGNNANFFKYSRNYYFRIGAKASVSGVGTVRSNYAPHVVIKF